MKTFNFLYSADSENGGGTSEEEIKRILDNRFPKDTFRDDEGDNGEEVKRLPAYIDPEKSKEFMKERFKELTTPIQSSRSGDPGEEEDLGPNPGNTLAGMMIEEKYSTEAVDRIREFRKSADTLRLTCLEFARAKASRELSSAITSFQIARQFCGKMMQERGAPYPYQDNKSSEIADGGEVDYDIIDILELVCEEDYRKAIIAMRGKVQNVITQYIVYCDTVIPTGFLELACQTTVLQELLKGKFWLGEILGIITKDEK